MEIEKLLNKTINLPTHFLEPVTVEHITQAQVDGYYKLRVRKTDGYLEEVTVTEEEIETSEIVSEDKRIVRNAEHLGLFVESHRIRDAYSYDRHFAVSLSGIQTQRKQAQEDFRTRAKICLATEAAGEGINLQFCHLMINYDIPWNPARLEQRMGRIHRIGQKRDVYVLNFVADESITGDPIIEGKILRTLLDKLERMREALGKSRVYDVIGEILSLNDVDLSDILRNATYNAHRLEEYLERLEAIDPQKLTKYEEMTGIALAKAYVNFDSFQRSNFIAEERRLMPEYIRGYFLDASKLVGLKVEERADSLLRVPYVPASFRSEQLQTVTKFGKPDTEYRKITFQKEDLDKDAHIDAVLVSPGHPLYAVVDEKLMLNFQSMKGGGSVFVDVNTSDPYWVHFLESSITDVNGRTVHKELSAIREEKNGACSLIPSDIHYSISPHPKPPETLPEIDIERVKDYLVIHHQLEKRKNMLQERQRTSEIIQKYLEESFRTRIQTTESQIMQAKIREAEGEPVDISKMEKDLEDLERTQKGKIARAKALTILRNGPVTHIVSFLVLPPGDMAEFADLIESEEAKRKSEEAAMRKVMEYETQRGWEPQDVSREKIGFDIRSLSPADPKTGYREVRRIEVKGRKRGANIRLTTNEWLKARQLRETYWLYVVWNSTQTDYEMQRISDPAHKLAYAAREIRSISHYEISGKEIMKVEESRRG